VKNTAGARLRPVTALARGACYCALALQLLLAGCANPKGAPGALASVPRLRAYSEAIDIGGRFSAQFERHDKAETWNGSFSWAQSPESAHVALRSPLGQTLATISVDGAVATLIQSGQAPRSAANVDKLVEESLGWPLPISNLRDWLQAYVVTSDGKRIMATPRTTDPIATRDGWRILFASWWNDDEIGARDVPKRIDLERETTEAGKVRIRVVITDWQARPGTRHDAN